MRVIIAGTRTFTASYWATAVKEAVKIWNKSYEKITTVVCGMAPGIDTHGREWALKKNIEVVEFPADWKTFGKRAGPIRNYDMAQYADGLILIWDGKSRGSASMLNEADAKGIAVMQLIFEGDDVDGTKDNSK